MTNEQMLAALLALPDADMLTATKIDDPLGAGAYYRADSVVRMRAELEAAARQALAEAADEIERLRADFQSMRDLVVSGGSEIARLREELAWIAASTGTK